MDVERCPAAAHALLCFVHQIIEEMDKIVAALLVDALDEGGRDNQTGALFLAQLRDRIDFFEDLAMQGHASWHAGKFPVSDIFDGCRNAGVSDLLVAGENASEPTQSWQ